MVSASLITIFLATVVSAAPYGTHKTTVSSFANRNTTTPSLNVRNSNSTKWTRDLKNDEVVLYRDGKMEVLHESDWHSLLSKEGISPVTPKLDQAWLEDAAHLAPVAFNETSDSNLHTRDCSSTFSIVEDKSERFVDWDVQMSPVVIGFGQGIHVSVASSYSVANAVSVSAGLDAAAFEKKLTAKFSVSYTRTWTTTATQTVRGLIEEGWVGTVITKPWKTRRYGRAFQGCPGSLKQTGTWIADSYEEGSYEGVKWVAGAITVCAKKQEGIPLSRCNGEGDFK
ncbi:uncharacterized protein CTRU02_214422 [Colletotrichum truncatum]|uniref:Uncharacterized protein n=1 Tax=Colletotrichum truncatum TaxID=5467 RepID=A0ACC3YG42_COLTU|nr:uncharacterized protein CTRU02_13473 [Colletotrichum truncatum]KAF6783237.1 hypothetical protein CTRU02_13473 [Colletotrichum truncatum]